MQTERDLAFGRCNYGLFIGAKSESGLGDFYKMSVFGLKTLHSDFSFVLYSAIFATKRNPGRKYRKKEKECVTLCVTSGKDYQT